MRPALDHQAKQHTIWPVFWLGFFRIIRPSRSDDQWHIWMSVPLTALGTQRICTAFPILLLVQAPDCGLFVP
jgi:hypothetical protein